VDKEVDTFPQRANYVKTTPAFTAIQKQAASMRGYTSKEVASGIWKRQSPNQTNGMKANLDTSGSWRTVRGNGFSIDAPGNWQMYAGEQGGGTIAPSGGIVQQPNGSPAVLYGAVSGVYRPQQQGMALSAALNGLVADIAHDNPGLVAGNQTDVNGNGIAGRAVECRNPQGGNGAGEQDWIVMFPQSDGNLRYFVFVAPSRKFAELRPAFERMIRSVTVA
jgi:hypothetical protein